MPESLGDVFCVRTESLHVAFLYKYLGVSVFAFYRILEENSISAFLFLHLFFKLYIAPKTKVVREVFVSSYGICGAIEAKCRRKN